MFLYPSLFFIVQTASGKVQTCKTVFISATAVVFSVFSHTEYFGRQMSIPHDFHMENRGYVNVLGLGEQNGGVNLTLTFNV